MPLLSVTEAAARYPRSATHIRRLARSGAVKARRFGKKAWAVDERSLMAYPARARKAGMTAVLSVAEAAARYPLSADRIRGLARSGVVKARRFGKTAWAVDEQSLRRLLAKERGLARRRRRARARGQ